MKRSRSRGIYLLPNLLTTGGLFSGFLAIICASQGHYSIACVAIFVSALLDGVDGRVARMTNTQSAFGMQYDSLADLVSFGMAPALLMYHWGLVYLKLDGATTGKIGWLVAFLYVACAALRLARFNSQISSTDKSWFIGLASPAAAGLLASFVWVFDGAGVAGAQLRYVALILTLVASVFMVGRIRYSSFKGKSDGFNAERIPFFIIPVTLLILIALVIKPAQVLLFLTVLYALSGPVLWLWLRCRKIFKK